jgi:hypothetical protein
MLGSMREFGERYRRPIEVETEEEKARLDQLLESKRKLSQDMLNGCGDVGPGEFADIERGAAPEAESGRRALADLIH